MQLLKYKLLIIVCINSISSFGQNNFSDIKSESLSQLVKDGYLKSVILLNRSIPKLYENNLTFIRYDLKNADEDFIDLRDSVKLDLTTISQIKYSFLYAYGKIGLAFSIFYRVNERTYFDNTYTLIRLKILDSLKKGFYKDCLTNLQRFIKINKFTKYRVMVEIVNSEAQKLPNRFLWSIVKTEKNLNTHLHFFQGGHATFVNPLTGKKEDIHKYFTPPGLKEN